MDRRHFLSSFLPDLPGSKPLATDSLAPWQPTAVNPWDRHAAKHLLHRFGVAPAKDWLDFALSMEPQAYINILIDDALINELLPDPPEGWELWLTVPPYSGTDPKGYLVEDDIYHMAKMDIRNQWAELMSKQKLALREKLTLFWSNHFVVQEQKVYHTPQVHRYLAYLRKNVWGNFKQMVKAMTIQPAMLVYLDGVWSEKDKLNENYARELMELFTMGITDRYGNPTYTQQDVRAVALALTGWRFRYESPAPNVLQEYFAWYYFDYETKTSPWGAEKKVYGLFASGDPKIEGDILDTMFEVRANEIAWHICSKLYRFFVHRDAANPVSESVIEQMADRLKIDWELRPVIEMLLRSEHFFDPVFRGAIVKSPHEMMLGAIVQLGSTMTQSRGGTMARQGEEMNQWLLDPVNVKGWPGHRSWLTSGTLEKRMTFLTKFISGAGVPSHYVDAHTGGGYEVIEWKQDEVLRWASQFPSVRKDVKLFVLEIAELLYAIEPIDEIIEDLLSRVITFPRYEWPSLTDSQRVIVIRKLALAMMKLPEYQIN